MVNEPIPIWLATVITGVIVSSVMGLLGFFAALAHRQLMQRLDRIEEDLHEHGADARKGIAEVHHRLDDHINFHLEQ